MKKGICKLCLRYKYLCKKSHIIPNHAYKHLKDNTGKLFYVDKSTLKKPGRSKKRQTGEFEEGILCQDCEAKISKWEKYYAELFYSENIKNINKITKTNEHGVQMRFIYGSGYKYDYIKLYFLSILWKSSISSRPFFNKVDLGKEINDKLRIMILKEFSGSEKMFPCALLFPAPMVNGWGFDMRDVGLTRNPYLYEKDDKKVADFLILGVIHKFFITENNVDNFNSIKKDRLEALFLTQEKTLQRRDKLV
jgi:hypothetical protein